MSARGSPHPRLSARAAAHPWGPAVLGAVAWLWAAGAAWAQQQPGAPALPGVTDGVRTEDLIWVRGNPDPIVCSIVEETPDRVRFRRASSPIIVDLPKAQIDHIDHRETAQDVYARRSVELREATAEEHLEFARWCQRHSLIAPADEQAWLALRASPGLVQAYDFYIDLWVAWYPTVEPAEHLRMMEDEIRAYQWAAEHGVDLPRVRLRRAIVYRAIGLLDEAAAELYPLVLPAEGETPPPDLAPAVLAEAATELGEILTLLEEYPDAEAAFARALAASGATPSARLLVSTARARFAVGDAAGAAERLASAQQASASDPEIPVGLAACRLALGDLEGAKAALAAATALSPTGAALLGADLVLGLVALQEGRVVDGLQAFDRALATDPTFYPAELGRGMAAMIQGDFAGAAERYAAAAVRARAGDGLPRYLEAEARAAAGDPVAAIHALREALRQGMAASEVMSARARLEEARGETALALRVIRYAAVGREDADLYYRIGRLMALAGDPEDARASFEAALALAPGHVPATVGLAFLQYERAEYDAAERLLADVAGRAGGPLATYVGDARERIRRGRTRLEWRDRFQRGPPAGNEPEDDVLNRWQEDEQHGILIGIRQGSVIFGRTASTGEERQTQSDEGPTRLVREIDRPGFIEFRASLNLDRAARATEAGIAVEATDGEARLYRSGDRLLFRFKGAGANATWSTPQDLGAWPAGEHDLGIAVDERERTTVYLLLDGRTAYQYVQPRGFDRGVRVAIYGQAPAGTRWGFEVREAVCQIRRP